MKRPLEILLKFNFLDRREKKSVKSVENDKGKL